MQASKEDGFPVTDECCHFTTTSSPAAFGDGAGIQLIATTKSGYKLGSAVPGRRGFPAEEVGSQAATELLEDLQHGGCVDRW